MRSGILRMLLVAMVGLVLAGCQLKTEVTVDVADDGSGMLEIAVALDDDAISRAPDLLADLAVDDLVDAGWEITGPAKEADDLTWVRATHDFASPDELGPLVAAIAGDDGPFRDFALTRTNGFASTSYDFTGIVDFTDGTAPFTDDPELEAALGAAPAEIIEDRIGGAIDEVVDISVGIRLPGDVDSNAPTKASNGAVWTPSVLEREVVTLQASSTDTHPSRLIVAVLAAVVGFALVLFIAIRVVLWRRRHAGLTA